MNSLTRDEKEFLEYKDEHSRGRIVKLLENGLSFDKAVIKEAGESLISYYDCIKSFYHMYVYMNKRGVRQLERGIWG